MRLAQALTTLSKKKRKYWLHRLHIIPTVCNVIYKDLILFSVRQDHKSEMDLQSQSHQIEVRSLETQHLTILQDHEARHSDILHEMEEKWKQTIARQLEEKTQELAKLTEDLDRQNEKYQESKRNLEHQLHSVQNELRQQEMAVSVKHKGTVLSI